MRRNDNKNKGSSRSGGRGNSGRGSSGRGSSSSSRGGDDRGDNRRTKQAADSFMKIRKKFCRFCRDKVEDIDYKDLNILEKLISEKGKIFSSRTTGTCAKHQRKVSSAIKRARYLSIIPYTR